VPRDGAPAEPTLETLFGVASKETRENYVESSREGGSPAKLRKVVDAENNELSQLENSSSVAERKVTFPQTAAPASADLCTPAPTDLPESCPATGSSEVQTKNLVPTPTTPVQHVPCVKVMIISSFQ
jgi:hypothetical protein